MHNVMLLLHSFKEVFSPADRHKTSSLPKIEARWLLHGYSRSFHAAKALSISAPQPFFQSPCAEVLKKRFLNLEHSP
jgi:hypothetical protein